MTKFILLIALLTITGCGDIAGELPRQAERDHAVGGEMGQQSEPEVKEAAEAARKAQELTVRAKSLPKRAERKVCKFAHIRC